MSTSTWAKQFLGGYLLAREKGPDYVRAKIQASNGTTIPGAKEAMEAIETGIQAFEMGMSEYDAAAWYQQIER
jgi:hypothetical protein